MAKSDVSDATRRKVARNAIAHAEKTAKKDPRAFVEALRGHALSNMPPPPASQGGGARSLGLRPAQPTNGGKDPKLADDPRYLANVRELARRTKRNARIIGGSAVKGKDFADCVAVGNDTNWGCTGTLISSTAVLTAGHCRELHTRVFVGNDVDGKGRVYAVKSFVRHPQWTGGLKNDLMVLILEKPVTGVKPRALATPAQINGAVDGRVVGFGTTDLAGTVGYGLKQQTDVPIVSNACRGKVKGESDTSAYGCHLGKEIVAGKPMLNHDTCRGDSGGPLYVAAGKGWALAGVTSRGTRHSTTMCGDGGLYTRVDEYRTWIASVIK